MKIGVFGGSFDSVHNGHIEIAQKARERFSLEKVYFIPCYIQPVKGGASSNTEDRVAMLNIAVEGITGFNVCMYEIGKKNVSYTVDTLKYIKSKNKENSIFFILGADSLSGFVLWKEPGKFSELCEFIVYPREGADSGKISEINVEFPGLKVNFMEGGEINVSSSAIRRQISEGALDKIPYLNENVKKYIRERRLYGIEKNGFGKNR
ncbi:MAG: nicotinate-nucleotide adenylyltransferase [bacterium]|nr:nicotinate-nucleotide adenylyltransferase [bacterium]